MGENDTAGLDPIFYFHHCFIDRVFWLWQKRHGFTKHLTIIPEYPGTNSVDNQGPTPGVVPNSWLTLESPLDPFRKKDGKPFTTNDCVDIEAQLGYTYGPGSLENLATPHAAVDAPVAAKAVHVSGLNRAPIRGSFLVSAFANIGGKRYHVGTEAVLSRWSVKYCANCQTHLEVKTVFPLHAFAESDLQTAEIEVEVQTRDGKLTRPHPATAAASLLPVVTVAPFRFEVR